MKKLFACALCALSLNVYAASTTLSENFDNLVASGWTIVNASSPVGSTSWFQGNPGVFSAQSGAANSYAAANFDATDPNGGLVNVWLISPEISFLSQTLSFWTRTESTPGALFNDGLRVLLSTAGASTALASFTTQLLAVNGSNLAGGYPDSWTQFSTLLALSSGSGRIGFEYLVPENANVLANYIGIDTVRLAVVPEPSTLILLALALLLLVVTQRRAGRP